jgi:hypothetical protein
VDEAVRDAIRPREVITAAVIGMMLIGVFLGTCGYGMVSARGISERRAEIGVRLALGGSVLKVTWEILRNEIVPVVIGLAAGVLASVPASMLARHLVAGVPAARLDGLVFGSVGLLLVPLLICTAPVVRGCQQQPQSLLRP